MNMGSNCKTCRGFKRVILGFPRSIFSSCRERLSVAGSIYAIGCGDNKTSFVHRYFTSRGPSIVTRGVATSGGNTLGARVSFSTSRRASDVEIRSGSLVLYNELSSGSLTCCTHLYIAASNRVMGNSNGLVVGSTSCLIFTLSTKAGCGGRCPGCENRVPRNGMGATVRSFLGGNCSRIGGRTVTRCGSLFSHFLFRIADFADARCASGLLSSCHRGPSSGSKQCLRRLLYRCNECLLVSDSTRGSRLPTGLRNM